MKPARHRYLGRAAVTQSGEEDDTNVRDWHTREDTLSTVWEQVREQIEENPGLEARTLEWLQRKYPGRYQDGRIRTLAAANQVRVAALTVMMMRHSGVMP